MLLVGFLPDIDRVADCFYSEVSLNNDRVESELLHMDGVLRDCLLHVVLGNRLARGGVGRTA